LSFGLLLVLYLQVISVRNLSPAGCSRCAT